MLGYVLVCNCNEVIVCESERVHTKGWEDEQVNLPDKSLLELLVDSRRQSRRGGTALQSQFRRLLRRRQFVDIRRRHRARGRQSFWHEELLGEH